MYAEKRRSRILQRIRASLGQQRQYTGAAFQRLREQAPKAHEMLSAIVDPVSVFREQATAVGAKIVELPSSAEVPSWVRASSFGTSGIVLSGQPEITALDWSNVNVSGDYRSQGRVGVVKASMAAAETGTVLQHSREVPGGLLYLVDTLVILLNRVDIKPRYEDMWAAFASVSGSATPRAVHLITGPSRTADVEQTIQVGAHGPREVYILVLGQG